MPGNKACCTFGAGFCAGAASTCFPISRRLSCDDIAGVSFQYRDPERNFDRGRVKGVVADLMHLQNPASTTEVAAGCKLYQVRLHPPK